MVPWMSGLVNGLQNRLQQFESARHLQKESRHNISILFLYSLLIVHCSLSNFTTIIQSLSTPAY